MNINHLACFIACAKYLNFTRAAEELHLVQSSVSYGVKELEKEYKVKLFDRKNGGIRLSEDGERLLPLAEKIMDQVNGFEEESLAISSGTRILTLGYDYMTNLDFLREKLYEFQQNNSGFRLNFLRNSRTGLIEDLEKNRIDLLIGNLSDEIPDIYEYRILREIPLYIMTNEPGSPEDGGLDFLRPKTLIIKDEREDHVLYSKVKAACAHYDLPLQNAVFKKDIFEVKMQVRLLDGYSVCPRTEYRGSDTFSYLRLDEAYHLKMGLMWKKENRIIRKLAKILN